MSWVLFRTGEWKRCIDVCQEVIRNPENGAGSPVVASCVLGLIRVYRGENQQARKLLDSAHGLAVRDHYLLGEMIACWGLALLSELNNQMDRVAPSYLRILDIRDELRDTHDCLAALFAGISYFAAQRSEHTAARCVNALSEIAAQTGNLEALATLAFALGELAMLQDEPARAVSQFRQALNQTEKLDLPIEHLRVEARLGAALAATGDTDGGIGHLRTAYRQARNLGARPLASRMAAGLEELDAVTEEQRTPEAGERASHAGLTHRQMEIARLIADGMTNKQIADKLYVSPRTVEMHVANLLDRLDCRNRSEAVHKAGALGLL
jgi:DNA-binding NarL/FixJ family response regulator